MTWEGNLKEGFREYFYSFSQQIFIEHLLCPKHCAASGNSGVNQTYKVTGDIEENETDKKNHRNIEVKCIE